jgi:hypothetical protein
LLLLVNNLSSSFHCFHNRILFHYRIVKIIHIFLPTCWLLEHHNVKIITSREVSCILNLLMMITDKFTIFATTSSWIMPSSCSISCVFLLFKIFYQFPCFWIIYLWKWINDSSLVKELALEMLLRLLNYYYFWINSRHIICSSHLHLDICASTSNISTVILPLLYNSSCLLKIHLLLIAWMRGLLLYSLLRRWSWCIILIVF